MQTSVDILFDEDQRYSNLIEELIPEFKNVYQNSLEENSSLKECTVGGNHLNTQYVEFDQNADEKNDKIKLKQISGSQDL